MDSHCKKACFDDIGHVWANKRLWTKIKRSSESSGRRKCRRQVVKNEKADCLGFRDNCRALFYVEIKCTYGNNAKVYVVNLIKENRANCLKLPCLILLMQLIRERFASLDRWPYLTIHLYLRQDIKQFG